MQAPLSHRKGIPFFYPKSPVEFRKDPYERYDPMVLRQTALHLADSLWGAYPFQPIVDWVIAHMPTEAPAQVLELGCGVGQLIGTLAQAYPAQCWGIDYSYQLLRSAQDYWVAGKTILLDQRNRGLAPCTLEGKPLKNLSFGLAKAEALPFASHSQDVVCSSFLFDRVEQPEVALAEMYRVLRPGGRMILVTPLNFQEEAHWSAYFPAEKLRDVLGSIGFKVLAWEDGLMVKEPLDIRGNHISWKAVAFAGKK